MPLAYGNVGAITSSDVGAGRSFTRFKGPLLIGPQMDNANLLNIIQPPHVINVSTGRGDMLISVVSSFANGQAVTSSSNNVSTGAPVGLVYISMATGAGNLMAAGSTANAPTGLPGGANGVALCYDAAKKTLALYDPFSSAWLWPHFPSTIGDTIVWSASSS